MISREALTFLVRDYAWPGNVRELKNLMERLTILTHGDTINYADVNNNLPHYGEISSSSTGSFAMDLTAGLKAAKDNFEKGFITGILKENDYNITKTAEILKVERSNLYKLMKRLGMEMNRKYS